MNIPNIDYYVLGSIMLITTIIGLVDAFQSFLHKKRSSADKGSADKIKIGFGYYAPKNKIFSRIYFTMYFVVLPLFLLLRTTGLLEDK